MPLAGRQWPDQTITRAPQWCSVDLRDGNQALINPMSGTQKRELFELLLKVGFKQIEVGFPAASTPDFEFVRLLIEQDLIPDDVTIQVLTQARAELIEKTFAALQGVDRAIVHLYNSTSSVQRRQVFGLDRRGISAIATAGAEQVLRCAGAQPQTDWTFQYSPESFTGTELDFAVDICDAVNAVWQPSRKQPVIINLPATVEMSTPNIYADQIEWFCRHVQRRDALIISLHTHNDRGCGVAAAELGLMAGADRVEGTLLGNGERTGNMDIVTMAMNLYSQGVAPQLQLGNMDEIIRTVKSCTQLPVHPRHPYAGELVFTAFSGSHQDAIKKCLGHYRQGEPWEVAYLPIDPRDLGRSYQEVIRINSQSGKGGVAYILQQDHGIDIPRWLQIDFSGVVQRHSEQQAQEVSAQAVWELFRQHCLDNHSPLRLQSYQLSRREGIDRLSVELSQNGTGLTAAGEGRGALEAFITLLQDHLGRDIVVVEYSEQVLKEGEATTQSRAIAYIQLSVDGKRFSGAGISDDIIDATFTAVLNAVNRAVATARKAA